LANHNLEHILQTFMLSLGIFYLETQHHGVSSHIDISYKAVEFDVPFNDDNEELHTWGEIEKGFVGILGCR
jgi:hypothetical protein